MPNPFTHATAFAASPLSGHSGLETHHQGIILHMAESTCCYGTESQLNSPALDYVSTSVLKWKWNLGSFFRVCRKFAGPLLVWWFSCPNGKWGENKWSGCFEVEGVDLNVLSHCNSLKKKLDSLCWLTRKLWKSQAGLSKHFLAFQRQASLGKQALSSHRDQRVLVLWPCIVDMAAALVYESETFHVGEQLG